MSEYIKREDVEKAIADIRDTYRKARNFIAVSAIDNAAGEIRECVKNADVASVVHGRWLNGCECSVCGDRHGPINEKLMPYYNFCSNCGAKMDGGDTNA